MSRKERVRRDSGGIHGKDGLLERISGIREPDARKLMEGDEYRRAKERQADECRARARDFLRKDARTASELLERAADVYKVLGEMEPDQFRQKECLLTASRLYDEAGWLIAEKDAARAAQMLAKSGDALAYMEGKCAPFPEMRGMLYWKNAARVKYSNAARILDGEAERLSGSDSMKERRRGLALGQEAAELRKRMGAFIDARVPEEGSGLLDAAG